MRALRWVCEPAWVSLLALVTPLALSAAPASAGQVALDSSKDNTLYNDLGGGTSNGAGQYFFSGHSAGTASYPIRRGVIAFDVASAIPPGSTVLSVKLRLHMSQTSGSAFNVALHRLTNDWGEGTSAPGGSEGPGANATNGDATWLHTFYPNSFWSTPGGDFAPTASATIPVDQIAFYTWNSTAQLVSDVQGWVNNPASNFGWLVKGNETTQHSSKRFDTHQNLDPLVHPLLTIDFRPPPLAYCTAKANSLGCVPAIQSSGTPSATAASGFVVSSSNVRNNKPGLLFYSIAGRNGAPFQGGVLCVKPPIKRTPAVNSNGNPLPADDCSGLYVIDMNAFAQGSLGGAPIPELKALDTIVDCQWWGRDPGFPAPDNTTLSDGLEYVVGP
jgi:hypothetical protein